MISTVFLVSGISTLLHSFFGSRLPLVQGTSFVYLAPALAIINSSEFTSIGNNVSFLCFVIWLVNDSAYLLFHFLDSHNPDCAL